MTGAWLDAVGFVTMARCDVGVPIANPPIGFMPASPLPREPTPMRRDRCPLDDFHPAIAAWFLHSFAAATAVQAAWPAIRKGEHTLVAAPTRSGMTLTALLAAIDALVCEGVADGGRLANVTSVVYVSPLKALPNDIHIDLEAPLERVRAALENLGSPDVAIHPDRRTHRRHAASRAQPAAQASTAYSGHDAGVPLRVAGLRFRTRDAGWHAHRDR